MFWSNGFWCHYLCISRLTCHSGLANHIFSKPPFLLTELSARKSHMPLRSLTSRLSESLGNNIPGRAAIIREIFKADKIKKEGKNICKKAMLRSVIDPRNLLLAPVSYPFKGCFLLGEGRVTRKNNTHDSFVTDCSNGVAFRSLGVVFEPSPICWLHQC